MNNRKKHPYAIFLGIIWALLLAGYITYFVTLFVHVDAGTFYPEYAYEEALSEQYGNLFMRVQSFYYNNPNVEDNGDLREIISFSKYTEAAFRKKAYEEAGDTEMTLLFEEKMFRYRSRMNRLTFVADNIDKAVEAIK